nr:MAG TPA: hypothetical protein [Caudoviricetes sp.]
MYLQQVFWRSLFTAGCLARKWVASCCSVIWLFASYSKTQQNNNVSRKAGVKKLRPFLYPKTN